MFNYEKLEQKIKEVFGSKEVFGKKLGLSSQEINSRLIGNEEFTLLEIEQSVILLNINPLEIPLYFFDIGACRT